MGSSSKRLRFSKRSPIKNVSTFEREVRGYGDSHSSEEGFEAEERRLNGAPRGGAPTETQIEHFKIHIGMFYS